MGRLTVDLCIDPWILEDGGALDVDSCPDCWERQAHIERYQFASKALTGLRVLDFGCGVGYGSQLLAEAGNDVTAVDSSAMALGIARARRSSVPGVKFQEQYAGNFDACVALEVIEHLDEPVEFLRSLRAHQIIASVPVIPTVHRNPHHRHDFTVGSFQSLLETKFSIVGWWPQILPMHAEPCIAVFHGIAKA